jgi:hypothetical protein
MKTLERRLDESLVAERMIATLSTVFGFLATALAILGLSPTTRCRWSRQRCCWRP